MSLRAFHIFFIISVVFLIEIIGRIFHLADLTGIEKKLHYIYENEYCLSPIPSLAMHSTYINSAYGIPPNFEWKKIWDENGNY